MTPQFRNLVFEGGAVKGIAHIGALETLSQWGYLDHIVRVGGASAGAINGLLFALGYSIREQRAILESTDFRQFMDDTFGVIRDVRRPAKHFGWHEGEFFRDWIGGLIEAKLGNKAATFAELQLATDKPELYVIGTNL